MNYTSRIYIHIHSSRFPSNIIIQYTVFPMPAEKKSEQTWNFTKAKKAPYLIDLAKEREFRNKFELERGKFMRTDTVAEILDIEPEVIREFIRKGELYAIRIGKSYRVTESDLQEFLNTRYTRKTREEEPEEK